MDTRFSIAIPTYNRAGLLQESLESVLAQTLRDIEIVVCDNASTDGTQALLDRYQGRLLSRRNDRNLGSWPNLKKAFAESSGARFMWLQDDDVLHRDFARRASSAFESQPDLKVYLAYAFNSPDAGGHSNALIWGPPFTLDWFGHGQAITIPGSVITPLSLFVSVGFSPCAAFDSAALGSAIHYADKGYYLVIERMLLARTAARGQVVIDPFLGALFRSHPQQISQVITRDTGLLRIHWAAMLEDLSALAGEIGPRWKADFAGILPLIPVHERMRWQILSEEWPTGNDFSRSARALVRESLPEDLLKAHQRRQSSLGRRTLGVIRNCAPPYAWDAASRAWKAIKRARRGNNSP